MEFTQFECRAAKPQETRSNAPAQGRSAAAIPRGEFPAAEFLEPLGLTAYRLAQETGMPRSRVPDILKGKRSITAETVLAFSLYFGNSARFLLNLQSHPQQSGERSP